MTKTKEGKIVIENEAPQGSGGKCVVVDNVVETWRATSLPLKKNIKIISLSSSHSCWK